MHRSCITIRFTQPFWHSPCTRLPADRSPILPLASQCVPHPALKKKKGQTLDFNDRAPAAPMHIGHFDLPQPLALLAFFMHPAPRLVYPRCLGSPQVDPQSEGHQKMPKKKQNKRQAPPKDVLSPFSCCFSFTIRFTYVSQCRTQSDALPQWVESSGSKEQQWPPEQKKNKAMTLCSR